MKKRVSEIGFLVYNEDDMGILTRMLYKNKKHCYVLPQRYDTINVGYYVMAGVLKTAEIQKILQEYYTAGGYEEPIVKFR